MRVKEMLKRFVSSFVLEPLLLRKAEQTIRSYTPEQHARLSELVAAAHVREWVAREIRDEASLPAALSLLREAISFSVSATLVVRGEAVEGALSAPEAAGRLAALIDADADSRLKDPFAAVEPLLADTQPLALDRLGKERAAQARSAAEQLVSLLLGRVEPRTLRAVRVQRVVRLALIAAAVIGVVWFGVAKALAPVNVALGKPVTQSSRYSGAPECSALVNGTKDGPYGCHTNVEANPWVKIDLLAPHAIREIVVSHRSDGYQPDILPLTLELSEDGQNFQEAGVRQELFTDSKPWKLHLDGRTARYVRLTVKRNGYIALHEVEVFGRRK
jgi:hypothetical protein